MAKDNADSDGIDVEAAQNVSSANPFLKIPAVPTTRQEPGPGAQNETALDEDKVKDNATSEAVDAEAAQNPSVKQSGAPSHSALVEKNKDKRSL